MEVNGQPHAVAALTPGKETAPGGPHSLKAFEKRKISFLCCDSSSGACSLQPSHYTYRAVATPRVYTTHKCYCTHSLTFQVMYRSLAIVLTTGTTHCDSRSMSDDIKHDTRIIYRVIHKSLRDFRTRLRNNQDRHGRNEHINR